MITQSIGSMGSTDIDLFKTLGNPHNVNTWDVKLPGAEFMNHRDGKKKEVDFSFFDDILHTNTHDHIKPTQMNNILPTQTNYNNMLPTLSIHDQKISQVSDRRKQVGLLELQKMVKMYNMKPSREYNMDDTTEDIWFEVDSLSHYLDEEKATKTMENVFKWILIVFEILNKKYGGYLAVENLASDVTNDMGQFRKCFSQIHSTYFKKKSSNPFNQLLWAFIGVVVTQHIRNSTKPIISNFLNTDARNSSDVGGNDSHETSELKPGGKRKLKPDVESKNPAKRMRKLI